jgi:predicted metal-dependent HD superfamily phosphohydrolase
VITLAAWHATWRELGAGSGDEALFRDLVRRWSEPHRRYHTLQHLRECLARFEPVRGLAQRPGEVALALWFHDAFYEPRRDDNEERSADWARDCVLHAGIGAGTASRVLELVMATRHLEAPEGRDAQLLVDVDLSILGSAPARFDESDAQIREEYAHVPLPAFREGRCRVLQGFLDRPHIYSTPHFHGLLEAQARSNLQRALDRLRSA